MRKWERMEIGKLASFNPTERLPANQEAKKIPMDRLGTFERKIKGYEKAEFKSGPKFRNGDTLVAKITPCLENGKTAYVDILEEGEVAFGSTEFIVLRANEYSDPLFIYYLARSPLFREKAISCMEGTSGRRRVNEGALKRQEVNVPDLSTQQAIADVLSSLDDKIELNNRINAELEKLAKLIYDYWFVQYDFPNAEGKPYRSSGGKMVYNETLKRDVPEGWEVQKLEKVGSLKNGINYNPKDIGDTKANIINVRNISQSSIFIDVDDLDVLELQGKDVQKYLVNEGSIIIARSGIPGATRLIKNYKPNTIYCGFIICLNVDDLSHQNYVYFRLKDIEAHLTSQSNGTIMQNVNQQVLNDVDIVVPEEKVLNSFNAIIDGLFEKIQNNLQQSAALASLRDWLLPMLMNGQAVVGSKAAEAPLSMAAEAAVAYGPGPASGRLFP